MTLVNFILCHTLFSSNEKYQNTKWHYRIKQEQPSLHLKNKDIEIKIFKLFASFKILATCECCCGKSCTHTILVQIPTSRTLMEKNLAISNKATFVEPHSCPSKSLYWRYTSNNMKIHIHEVINCSIVHI